MITVVLLPKGDLKTTWFVTYRTGLRKNTALESRNCELKIFPFVIVNFHCKRSCLEVNCNFVLRMLVKSCKVWKKYLHIFFPAFVVGVFCDGLILEYLMLDLWRSGGFFLNLILNNRLHMLRGFHWNPYFNIYIWASLKCKSCTWLSFKVFSIKTGRNIQNLIYFVSIISDRIEMMLNLVYHFLNCIFFYLWLFFGIPWNAF